MSMLGFDEIKALLEEVKGMRSDSDAHFKTLIEGVNRINKNLEEIEKQNKERFDRRNAALKAELGPTETRRIPRHHR